MQLGQEASMSECLFRARSVAGALTVLVLTIVWCTSPTPAAERVVLCEEFTATWCTGCPDAGAALSQLMENYSDTFVMVQYHYHDAYSQEWGTEREDFYDVPGAPVAVFDGVNKLIAVTEYEEYEAAYNARRAVPTDADVVLHAEQVEGQTYRVSAEICVEVDGQGKDVRLYIVQVLDYWPGPDQGEDDYYRNGFKQAAEPEDLTLIPGMCTYVERELTFDDDSWANQEDITIVAWLQEPNDTWPAEVYQAAMLDWPFTEPDCVGDADGDGDTDHADLGILLADWGCDDPGNGCAGDLDGDDDTDHADLGILLADWGCGVDP
jgi:hypothetical protein